jgi:hypothetical protein
MKNAVFWDMAPCSSCVNWRFGGTYRLHLQGRKISEQGASVSRWFQPVCSHLLTLVAHTHTHTHTYTERHILTLQYVLSPAQCSHSDLHAHSNLHASMRYRQLFSDSPFCTGLLLRISSSNSNWDAFEGMSSFGSMENSHGAKWVRMIYHWHLFLRQTSACFSRGPNRVYTGTYKLLNFLRV